MNTELLCVKLLEAKPSDAEDPSRGTLRNLDCFRSQSLRTIVKREYISQASAEYFQRSKSHKHLSQRTKNKSSGLYLERAFYILLQLQPSSSSIVTFVG